MERENRTVPTDHLSDDELFSLAVPAAGAPEPLPAHLSECLRCSRALADWKGAVRELGDQDEETLARRSADEWRGVENATLDAIRSAGAPGRGRMKTLRWALPAAASLLLFALLVGSPNGPSSRVIGDEDTTGFSAQDRADDALLREVERLASGEESPSGWGALVPEPAAPDVPAAEERS